MIGSVTEFDAQMREQLRRREEIAAQQAAAAVPPAAAPVTGGLAGAVAGAGYAPAGVALKAAESDVVKRKSSAGERRGVAGDAEELREHPGDGKGKRGKAKGGKRDRIGRDLKTDPMTPAHEAAEAGQHSRKNDAERDITLGPGEGREPGRSQPQDYRRDYVSEGHGSEAPMSAPPRTNPMPAMQHHVMPDQPWSAAIPPEAMAQFTMGSPSDK